MYNRIYQNDKLKGETKIEAGASTQQKTVTRQPLNVEGEECAVPTHYVYPDQTSTDVTSDPAGRLIHFD